jgi:hypothetical protein
VPRDDDNTNKTNESDRVYRTRTWSWSGFHSFNDGVYATPPSSSLSSSSMYQWLYRHRHPLTSFRPCSSQRACYPFSRRLHFGIRAFRYCDHHHFRRHRQQACSNRRLKPYPVMDVRAAVRASRWTVSSTNACAMLAFVRFHSCHSRCCQSCLRRLRHIARQHHRHQVIWA